MNDFETLLDTPKKKGLQAQSTELRLALKEFERAFVEDHGRKPKQTDIKNDLVIAAKYKKYQKLQDVLAGKTLYEKLLEASPQKKNKKRHDRVDSALGSNPQRRRTLEETPRKNNKAWTDVGLSPVSLKPVLLDVIGPTPHRDGKVLGLFDLLQNSVSEKNCATPSASARKRKIEELYSDTPARRLPLKVIQTPSHRSGKTQGDILEFLAGTPQKSTEGQEYGKHSRTPQSDGKRFALSQLFATPSTQRFLFTSKEELGTARKTSIGDKPPERTPQREPNKTGLDATPAYLKRSTSFKDRLLSATAAPKASQSLRPASPSKPIGPPTLRHFRSSTSNIFRTIDLRRPAQQPIDNAENDDDLEALRELEGETPRGDVLVEDSQFGLPAGASSDVDGEVPRTLIKPYKKKGQKRTTKKSNIRPATQKKASEPKFVAADDSDQSAEESDADNIVDETQFPDADDDGSAFSGSDVEAISAQKGREGKSKNESDGKGAREVKGKDNAKRKQPGMINPNAQSHLNFRSLKIKNKNSKAKGAGRNRFGRSRR